MCCCIPLRRLSYFGAAMHMFMGLVYFYFLGSVVYTMYKMRDKKDNYDERLRMGLLYVGYYAAFLPPGIFIFWGVHKKLRCFLLVPSIIFFFIQIYGVTLEGIYKFRPQGFPEAMEKYNDEGSILARLQADYWMDMCVQLTVTLTYVFMLFFYYREIGPEDNTSNVQSRYAQAYLQQQQLQQSSQEQSPHPHSHPHPHPHQQSHPMGPQVPFRPVSQPHPHLTASNTRNSTPCPLQSQPQPQPQLNLGGLNLTYEQQQQLLKLQQNPFILQQLQQQQQLQQHDLIHHHQQQQHPQHPQHRGDRHGRDRGHHYQAPPQHPQGGGHQLQIDPSAQGHHLHDQQGGTPLSMFHPYVPMSHIDPGSKTPKF